MHLKLPAFFFFLNFLFFFKFRFENSRWDDTPPSPKSSVTSNNSPYRPGLGQSCMNSSLVFPTDMGKIESQAEVSVSSLVPDVN